MPELANLQRLREWRFLSEQDLAVKADIPRYLILQIESGRAGASANQVKRLALALGVSVDELVGQQRTSA